MDGKIINLELIVKDVEFQNELCRMAVFQNVNRVIHRENDRMQTCYQEALTATISHEQMNPL